VGLGGSFGISWGVYLLLRHGGGGRQELIETAGGGKNLRVLCRESITFRFKRLAVRPEGKAERGRWVG